MILVTGLPRTASSFLCEWFAKEGDHMNPKCYSDFLPTNYTVANEMKRQLCEPITLTHEMTFNRNFERDKILQEVQNICDNNFDVADGKEQVLKCALFVFNLHCLQVFDKVIICTRDKESWIESAKEHGTFNWIYRCRPKWIPDKIFFDIINSEYPEVAFYDYWFGCCKDAISFCIAKGIEVIEYKYADNVSFYELSKHFGLHPMNHEDCSYWVKRRF